MASDGASTAAAREGPAQQQQQQQQQPTPESVITKGKTFLAVQDYFNAVGMLADGCRLLTDKHGETADELAEPYLYYGRALLGLAREEQAVLGTGLPSGVQEPGEAEEEEEEEEAQDDEEEEEENNEEPAAAGGSAESKEEAKDMEPGAENGEAEKEKKADKKEAEKVSNGEASTSSAAQNGEAHENGNGQDEEGAAEGDAEDVDNEDDDDGSSNLQIAWEVLELAKMIVQKRADSVERNQFLSEAHRLLGEVALESGNQSSAIGDLSTCLDIMRELEKVTSRQLAEVHYQLGLAYSLGSEYSKGIEHFEEALTCLDKRISELKSLKEPEREGDSKDEPEEEIKEIQELIPEIKEKISDMNDMKQQACKKLLESIKEHINEGGCSNGAGPSGASTSSSSSSSSAAGASTSSSSSAEAKPASDINHLIRKKRKNEDGEPEGSPCKK